MSSARGRVEAGLRIASWPTARELAQQLLLSDSTVRGHLYRLLVDGLAERKVDPDVPSPRGGGADRWHWLASPIGPPTPTHRILCDRCAARTRTRRDTAWPSRPRPQIGSPTLPEVEIEQDEPQSNCEACAGPLLPV